MKKIFCLFLLFAATCMANAQVQQGYVKTIGRPGKPGHALNQVAIRIKGEANSLLSDDKGEFSFDIRRGNNSNTFIISSVRKKGYVIADNDLTSRPYPYSATVPTIVVMVSQADLDADKHAIEEKTRQAVQSNYDQRQEELERQLKESTISEEHYKAELAALLDWYDNIDNLVAKMAEYYARVDYDHLTEEDAAINLCIERGQLDRADSLIDARGKIDDRIFAAKSQIEQGQRLQASGASLEQNGRAQLRSAQQDAEHKYNIAMARFDNQTALEMLVQLVESDSTNCDYLLKLADFYRTISIDYQKSDEIYNTAVEMATAQKDTIEVAAVLNNHGILLAEMGRYDESLDHYKRALELRLACYDGFSFGLASIYNNIICHYIEMRDFSEALAECKELLALIDASEDKDLPQMIETRMTLMHHVASINAQEGRMDEAEIMMEEHRQSVLKQYGRNSSMSFSAYNSLGWLYDKTERPEKAIECYNEALDIALTLYGENHVDVAAVYSNISSAYMKLGKDKEAWEYADKALDIRRRLLGNNHPDVAISLHNIGTLLVDQEDYEASIPYFLESAQIRERVFPALYTSTADSYLQLAISYASLPDPDYQKAVEYGKRALAIYSKHKGKEYHYFLAAFGIAQNLKNLQETEEAISVLKDLCAKDADWLGDHSHYLIAAHVLLRKIYFEMGDMPNALEAAIGEFNQFVHTMGTEGADLIGKFSNIFAINRKLNESGTHTANTRKMMEEYLQGIIPNLTVASEESAAGQAGWSGTYDIMHYNDWDFDGNNAVDFFAYMETQAELPKEIILARDGQFFSHTFEKKIGAMMTIRLISQEERRVMLKRYKQNQKKLLRAMIK